MRIGFVHCLYESLGIEYLSSYLKNEGHEVILFFDPILFNNYLINNKILDKIFSYKNYLIDLIVKKNPDVVAFSVLSDNYAWCCDIAKEVKSHLNTIVVFGGIHVTAVPYKVLKNEFVDFVICGEGEEAIVELINNLSKDKDISAIKNLGYKNNSKIIVNSLRPPIANLDLIPFPDKDLFYNEYKDFVNEAYMIITARGCLYKCSYCCENFTDRLYGKYYRRRMPNNVIEELVWAKKRYGIKRVNFQDSVFTCDRDWLEEFLPQYKRMIALPFFCFIYPSPIIDEKLINILCDAGCVTVNIGIQSINSTIRKNFFFRYETDEEITRVISIIKKTNLYLYLDFVLFPLQTKSELEETLIFCSRLKADFVAIAWLVYYPGTEIINISKSLGILNDNDIDSIEEGRDYLPYFKKSGFYIKTYSKIANIMYISGLIPLFLMKMLIKFKLYNYITSRDLFLPFIITAGLIKQLTRRKFPFSYRSVLIYFVRYYYFYMIKKL